jgi:hypothetical protein
MVDLIFIRMPSSISNCSKMVFLSIFRCLTISLSITMIFRLDISNTFLMIRRFSGSFNWESLISVFSFRHLLMLFSYRSCLYRVAILVRQHGFHFVFSDTNRGSAVGTNCEERVTTTIDSFASTSRTSYWDPFSSLYVCIHILSDVSKSYIQIAAVPY